MIPIIATGHSGPNGPSVPPPSVDTASLAEDAQSHPRNIENLMVAFRGKEGLMNLDDGGSSSRSAPHLVSGSLRGCFALNTISHLRRVRLRWSLDATDGHAFGTEQKHLIRTVPILLDQDCQGGGESARSRSTSFARCRFSSTRTVKVEKAIQARRRASPAIRRAAPYRLLDSSATQCPSRRGLALADDGTTTQAVGAARRWEAGETIRDDGGRGDHVTLRAVPARRRSSPSFAHGASTRAACWRGVDPSPSASQAATARPLKSSRSASTLRPVLCAAPKSSGVSVHAFKREQRKLKQTLLVLLARQLEEDELGGLPELDNKLQSRGGSASRAASKSSTVRAQREETRRAGGEMSGAVLAGLGDKPTVLVVCSAEFHLVLRDCIAHDDLRPRLLADERLFDYSQNDPATLLPLHVSVLLAAFHGYGRHHQGQVRESAAQVK